MTSVHREYLILSRLNEDIVSSGLLVGIGLKIGDVFHDAPIVVVYNDVVDSRHLLLWGRDWLVPHLGIIDHNWRHWGSLMNRIEQFVVR